MEDLFWFSSLPEKIPNYLSAQVYLSFLVTCQGMRGPPVVSVFPVVDALTIEYVQVKWGQIARASVSICHAKTPVRAY